MDEHQVLAASVIRGERGRGRHYLALLLLSTGSSDQGKVLNDFFRVLSLAGT